MEVAGVPRLFAQGKVARKLGGGQKPAAHLTAFCCALFDSHPPPSLSYKLPSSLRKPHFGMRPNPSFELHHDHNCNFQPAPILHTSSRVFSCRTRVNAFVVLSSRTTLHFVVVIVDRVLTDASDQTKTTVFTTTTTKLHIRKSFLSWLFT